MLRIIESKQSAKLLTRRAARMAQAERTVRPILDDVRKRGDKALLEYARRFDKLEAKSVVVPGDVLEDAWDRLAPELQSAIREAAKNIRAYAEMQLPTERGIEPAPGVHLSQIVRPLDTVAAYIPSGRYPLPSTLLMTAIPARVAGVRYICAASPKPADAVLGTAAGRVDRFYQMGGAHAIAAFAFGTNSVPRADRIVGPGSIWVAAAKKILAGETGIDFIAGPTEILIVAGSDGDPRAIAADMLAQAEHDTDASAVLLTPSKRLALAVVGEVEKQLKTLPTAAVARKAIDKNSAVVLVASVDEAIELSNSLAPEHLSIPDATLLPAIRHAGSVFIGPHSPEAAGDYCSGPNHVLPTGGAARLRGGLSAADFVKVISVQQLSPGALQRLTPSITTLARAEGLEAHARSVEVRGRA